MEKFTFFYRSHSPFSQWYPSDFVVDGLEFNCAEQYMMFKKAQLFGDEEAARKIMLASTPREQKARGRSVRGFDQSLWDQNCRQFVYDGNYAKFTQNPNLLKYLLKTKGTTLVEASPTDTIWGVGLAENDARIYNRKSWRGTNWLGEILTNLREDILKKEELSS
ncbi:NADAR family protein [Paenibacillus peoriae]|uniref:NADAR family protein n=1 Tax=Paenibacillus peoriae TaxID=59893 RepID=UPI00026C66A4|nr:NADAR family protein [Paenibacillus peoriae]MEC0184139.1 NADAR family protein [Paenibacillus peoriae]